MSFRQKLERLISLGKADYGNVRAGARDWDLVRTRVELKKRFNAILPDDYAEFLATCDGLEYDSLTLYTAFPNPRTNDEWGQKTNIVRMTEVWRQPGSRDHLVTLGSFSGLLYVVDLKGGNPQTVAWDCHDEYDSFASVGEMLEFAFSQVLD